MRNLYGSASYRLALSQERCGGMGKSSPRFTSGQVHWSDTGAGNLAIPHLCLGAYLVITGLLYDFELNDLFLNDFKGFIVVMSLAVVFTVTAFGTLVIYFVVQAKVRGSERYARYGYWLAVAYLCFIVAVVGISWTYLIGYATVSLLYFAESIMLLVFARRTFRELCAAQSWASMR